MKRVIGPFLLAAISGICFAGGIAVLIGGGR